MTTFLNIAIQIAITLAIVAVAMAIIESLKRRGFDPVGRVAAFLSPPTEQPMVAGDL